MLEPDDREAQKLVKGLSSVIASWPCLRADVRVACLSDSSDSGVCVSWIMKAKACLMQTEPPGFESSLYIYIYLSCRVGSW